MAESLERMPDVVHRFTIRPITLLGTTLLGLLVTGAGWAEDELPSVDSDLTSPKPNSPQALVATIPAGKPLNLLLTQAELRSFIRSYEIETGKTLTAPIDEDEVIVSAPGYHAPMRDVSQEAWGGIAAPFWAIMHPKDAWRIFVPIPPKGRSQESEPPAPDPR